MNDMEDILTGLQPCIETRRTQKMQLQQLLMQYKDQIVIYGFGNLGQTFAKHLQEVLGIKEEALYFLDTYKSTDVQKHVINISDAKQYIKTDALIIVTMYQVVHEFEQIQTRLQKQGFQNIRSIAEFKAYPELLQYGLISCDVENIDKEAVFKTYELLGDQESKKEYCKLFRYILANCVGGGGKDFPIPHLLEEKQYLATDIYQIIENENIVDCGAFNGDTMRALWGQLAPKGWESYTAVEPDRINRHKLQQSVENDLPDYMRDKVQVIAAAVSDQAGTVCFATTGSSASCLTKQAEDMISVVRLDDVIQHPVTFLKMDIEGYEMRALKGAEQLIINNQPLMAICGYHHLEDLWEIPLYLKKLLPSHQIYLRNYAGVIEYVFYAVPSYRVIVREG